MAEAAAAAVDAADPSAAPSRGAHFEVIDALDGAVTLVERSQTLDGSLPLRVVQGCVPFLEGNAYGLQIALRLAWRARRSLGRWRVEPVAAHEMIAQWGLPKTDAATPEHDALDALTRARVATLIARGMLPRGGAWARSLDRAVTVCDSPAGAVIRVFTGLLVKPAEGCVLRVARCANRRSLAYDVAETLYADATHFTPLVVDCVPARGETELRIEGEIATLSALPRGSGVTAKTLEAMPEIGRRHLRFYDAAYFDEKRRGEVTRKYRRTVAVDASPDPSPGVEGTVIVTAGPGSFDTERSANLASPEGVREGASPVDVVRFANEVEFTARWDGVRVLITWDRAALDARSAAIWSRWRALYPEIRGRDGEGALLYFTRYFTPHPHGEPHCFTKPSSFVVTPAGWSSLVEGAPGDRYDVLRGLVRTDAFHAAPAVFAFGAPCEVKVPAGRCLVRVLPTPRELATPRYTAKTFEDAVTP